MSGKPFHAGHDGLVRLAASECDQVHLFVSTSDRDNVSGKAMEQIWHELIEPGLPKNVDVTYGGSPVGLAFKLLGDSDAAGSQDSFSIYSDPDDSGRFDTLPKYAPNLVNSGRVKNRIVERTSTVDISGTQMRQWLAAGDREQFIKHLPAGVDGERYWDILSTTVPEPGTKQRTKKPVKGEALLRCFVRDVLRS